MMHPSRADRPYDVVIDLTGFAAGSQPPVQWLKFITEITPSDLRSRKRSIYFLNMNDLAHRFVRKIRNLSAGVWRHFLARFPDTHVGIKVDGHLLGDTVRLSQSSRSLSTRLLLSR